MRRKRGQKGITLTEMTITVAVAAFLTVLALPSIRSFTESLTTGSGAKAMISAAFASARALAAKNQTYTGIRFQCDQNGDQYMIYIEKRLENLVSGFCAVDGLKPIKLPEGIGVMDLLYNQDQDISTKSELDRPDNFTDTTTFSIVFSPSGKLVIQDVRVRNRDGVFNNTSLDPLFNTDDNVEDGIGIFIQDDYPALKIEPEQSRRCFAIYDKTIFSQLQTDEDYREFISQLRESMTYINPHTGTFINR